MHQFKTVNINILMLALIAFLGWVFVTPVVVEAVTIGPAKIEASVDPGDEVTGEFFLKNEEQKDQTFYSSVQKFTEQNGAKVFLDDVTPLTDWLSIPEEVVLEAGESQRFAYSFDVPEDAPPGGHFGVIWWSTTPAAGATSSQQVSITTRAGALVYLNVSGDIQHTAEIADFSTNKSLVTSPDISFALNIENTGTVYIQPSGSIEISSVLGKTRAELPINEKRLQILPESDKSMGLVFSDEAWYWGPYKATANVHYGLGEDGREKIVSESAWFWVIPPLSTILILLLLALIAAAPFGIRRYNRWVIKQSQNQQ